jgi:hypothetical protein
MTRPVAAPDAARLLGRNLLTLANVITVAALVAADWNDSHIFNKRWPVHARFHGMTALAMATSLAVVNIWSLWSGGTEQSTAPFFAAALGWRACQPPGCGSDHRHGDRRLVDRPPFHRRPEPVTYDEDAK